MPARQAIPAPKAASLTRKPLTGSSAFLSHAAFLQAEVKRLFLKRKNQYIKCNAFHIAAS